MGVTVDTSKGVRVTEAEYLRLLNMTTRENSLESGYLSREYRLRNVPGNQWAFKLLLEWRTAVEVSGADG